MKIKVVLVFGCCYFLLSCQSFLKDINVNPNDPTSASLENLMTAAMVSFLGYNEGQDARLAGMWSQQFKGSDRAYRGLGQYNVTSSNFDFYPPYGGVIQTTNLAIDVAGNKNNRIAAGVMKVLKGATFGYLASRYGDVPFTEAAKYEEFPDPKYDPQDLVYSGVHAILEEAIADIESGQGGIPVDIFGLIPTWDNELPQRFLIPQEERNSNANVPIPTPGLFDPLKSNQ